MKSSGTARPALLVMDMQNMLVERMAAHDLLGPIQRAVAAAREHAVPVIYVRLAFRAGHPEVLRTNPVFAPALENDLFIEDAPGTQIHEGVGRLPGDPVVGKKRVSAFAGADLTQLLRAYGVTDVVLAGIATSGVVLSTAREAADQDYRVTILRDACKDGEADLHEFLMERVLPRSGTVTDVAAWVAGLDSNE